MSLEAEKSDGVVVPHPHRDLMMEAQREAASSFDRA